MNEGFDYKDKHYRPITIATLEIMQALDDGNRSDIKAAMDFLLLHGLPIDQARKLAKDREAWDAAAYALADGFSVNEWTEINKLMEEQISSTFKTRVEPLPSPKKKR
jgi:hypothetical protein